MPEPLDVSIFAIAYYKNLSEIFLIYIIYLLIRFML